ncbi:histone H1-delta-like isoform X1 [Hydra vulgaris]|uniref:histone H1-delta-like isoform X1 n=1 Tax=Hydra vulgaris TaxID=6087 RepID=UPI001F5FA08F|nr:histone H1-delta-like [Hydra vulgaris]XP_047130258.1 histone H1-delta-like [Hydra vulgaris]
MSETASPKKIAKKSAPKKPADHAPYKAMIVDAINSLKERKGSSRQAIAKHVKANNKVGDNVDSQVKINLKRMVVAGELVQVKGVGASGSFRVAAKPKAAKKKSPVATVKKVKKESKEVKKSTPKKKAAPTKKVTAAAKEKAKKPKEKAAKKTPAKKSAQKPLAAKKPAAKKAKATPKKKVAAKKTTAKVEKK